MAKTNPKVKARKKRVQRIRVKITGTSQRPRLCVFRSNRHIYAQIIDDTQHKTLVSMSTEHKDFNADDAGDKCAQAKQVGLKIAEKAKSAGIEQVVFDRGGNVYHGRVKSLSEGAREGGLQF
ncbi:50S ribosomal protein L18 [Desulfobulbus rhabdoformis]|jgi:large subunit ribosomal protein L18|uniref:50S ribosomal protein L18 n=1 Tax=Desulfobulbus rhabdoformis TaxID=34032 RepID=UPI00196253E8|nr:50S ribosomal protein L18 [Desulfobulbus rhabdoformis]MBM9614623.1 50S ribosomal protein L18 [Desulfobulbus rhabdoformis]